MHDIEEMYNTHAQTVYKYLITLSHDVNIAEELTQETFYQAIRTIKNFKGDCKPSSWLCQIAKHSWYNYLRKRGKEELSTAEDFDLMVSEDTAVIDLIIQKERKVDLYRRLHNLDDKSKEVVHLRLTGELSFREIGDICCESENWARVTFYRAKQKIMREVEKK